MYKETNLRSLSIHGLQSLAPGNAAVLWRTPETREHHALYALFFFFLCAHSCDKLRRFPGKAAWPALLPLHAAAVMQKRTRLLGAARQLQTQRPRCADQVRQQVRDMRPLYNADGPSRRPTRHRPPPPTLTEDAFRANPCRTGFLRNVSAPSPGGTRQRCGRSLACPSSLPPRVTRCLGPWRARPRNRGGLKPARPGSTSRDLAGHTRCEMPHQASRCRKAPFASPGAPVW